jgi:hypothetical protein
MTDARGKMAEAIKEQTLNLARLRRAHPSQVLSDMTVTFAENADLSAGTEMQSYWRLMADVARTEVREMFP